MLRESLYKFTVRALEEMCLGYMVRRPLLDAGPRRPCTSLTLTRRLELTSGGVCVTVQRSLELHKLPGFHKDAGMPSRNMPADWPLHLEASLQLHLTTKGGLLGDAASQASVSTRVHTIPYEPR